MVALVIAEHDNASLKGSTLHTVTAAAQCGGDVHVLVAGSNAGAAAAAAQIAGVSKVIVADAAYFADGLAENVAEQVLAIAGATATSWRQPPPTARTSCRAWPPSWTWRRFRKSPRSIRRHLRASDLRR
jgi:electron transfer flavoprotein alpha subunit